MLTHLWSLWALSWQSRQVSVSHVSQKSTSGSCLCTEQYTARSPSFALPLPVGNAVRDHHDVIMTSPAPSGTRWQSRDSHGHRSGASRRASHKVIVLKRVVTAR